MKKPLPNSCLSSPRRSAATANPRRPGRLSVSTAAMFVCMAVLLLAYEFLKESLAPQLTRWESHLMTIAVSSIIAALLSCFVMRRTTVLHQTLLDEAERRRKMEDTLRESERRVRKKLDTILSPEADVGTLELADVIDRAALQRIFDNFSTLTHYTIDVVDLHGNILAVAGFQDICTKFHRVHPETCKHCVESDVALSAGVRPGEFKTYQCKNKLWDVSTPIMVGGTHMGNLFIGQFFFKDEVVDYDAFRAQARQYGFDEEEYIAALDRVPRWSREEVNATMAFCTELATLISTLSYSSIKLSRTLSERERAEEELRKYRDHLEELVEQRTAELVLARDQAQAANRAKSAFLASMSHELRTPLNAVLGFSQLMRTDPTLNESQKENLDIINRSGTHLLGLINDVLDMSRIESGRAARDETSFDLWDTLDTVKEMMRSRATAKGLPFILERDPALPRHVKTDERKLKQILINLAGNAVKFTQQGQVVLRARAENNNALLRFEVEDTGPGIDAQAIPTLFQPFVQGGPNREGTGLGLSISQKLAALMGGQVTVRSEPDKGSLFSFDIPCESATAAATASQSDHRHVMQLAPGQTPPRVLVAEDTPDSRLLMTKTLRSTGFEVIEAENGMEAVQLFEGQQPDLVLMDMRMPVMDGYEAIRRIRASQRGQTTPIIAVTASAFEEDQQKILALGADNFVSKPMQAAELFEKIRLLLGIAYIYAEERAEGGEAVDRAGLRELVAQLPEDLFDELAHAMTVLDLDGFRALLPRVAEHNPLLAEKLSRLANSFRVTELAKLFPARSPQ